MNRQSPPLPRAPSAVSVLRRHCVRLVFCPPPSVPVSPSSPRVRSVVCLASVLLCLLPRCLRPFRLLHLGPCLQRAYVSHLDIFLRSLALLASCRARIASAVDMFFRTCGWTCAGRVVVLWVLVLVLLLVYRGFFECVGQTREDSDGLRWPCLSDLNIVSGQKENLPVQCLAPADSPPASRTLAPAVTTPPLVQPLRPVPAHGERLLRTLVTAERGSLGRPCFIS